MEWMDMDSAPKDGTAILVANTDGAWIAYYCDQYQSGYRPDNPWQSLMLNRRYMKKKYASEVPTGWMLLPEPPKETEANPLIEMHLSVDPGMADSIEETE